MAHVKGVERVTPQDTCQHYVRGKSLPAAATAAAAAAAGRCEHVCCLEACIVAHVKRVERITPQVTGQHYVRSKSLQAAAAAAAAYVSMCAVLKPPRQLMSKVLNASRHKTQASTTSAARACQLQRQQQQQQRQQRQADVSMSAVLKPASWLMSNVLNASRHKVAGQHYVSSQGLVQRMYVAGNQGQQQQRCQM
jgi:hypothetical protein